MLGPGSAIVAATESLDLTGMSLFEAAQCAVSHLEHRRDAGLPLNPEAVKLASLLARLEGESAVSGASTGDLFLERAYARDRARLLADRYAAGLRVWSRRPEIPEAEPEPAWTLYDLIRLCESLARDARRWRARRAAARLR